MSTNEELFRRKLKIASYRVGFGVAIILGFVAILPILPWFMGIITNMKHVFIQQVPEENRGAYLVTDQGVMQLYSWYIQPEDFPIDAPTLDSHSIQSIAIVQKQFDIPENYQLYNITVTQHFSWSSASKKGMQLSLDPGILDPGEYMLIVPTDSMFGGKTYHYFRLE